MLIKNFLMYVFLVSFVSPVAFAEEVAKLRFDDRKWKLVW